MAKICLRVLCVSTVCVCVFVRECRFAEDNAQEKAFSHKNNNAIFMRECQKLQNYKKSLKSVLCIDSNCSKRRVDVEWIELYVFCVCVMCAIPENWWSHIITREKKEHTHNAWRISWKYFTTFLQSNHPILEQIAGSARNSFLNSIILGCTSRVLCAIYSWPVSRLSICSSSRRSSR